MIYKIGDLQLKEEEPYRSAISLFVNWLSKLVTKEDILIFLGDMTERGWATSEENNLLVDMFFNKLNFKDAYICHGNHTYHKKVSTLKFLKNFDNIHVIDKPELLNINGKKFLFLPFLLDKIDGMTMKEYYENLPDELNQGDYVIGHFHYKPFFNNDKSWVDISNIKGKIILGHDHSGHLQEGKDFYLGSPLIDRYDHRDKVSYIMTIDDNWKENFIEVPRFIDYQSVDYPNPLPEKLSHIAIWDIHNVVDKDLAIEHYKKECSSNEEFYYRKVHIKILESENDDLSYSEEDKKFGDYLNHFYVKKKVPEKVQVILNNKLHRRLK